MQGEPTNSVPSLTLSQAAAVLGKSIQSLERSLAGRWGNKLPDGWTARKNKTNDGEQWRITPPPGFKVRQVPTESQDQDESQESFAPTTDVSNTQLALPKPKRWRPERRSISEPAIIIDRSDEVEHLLRELLSTQKALSEERRLHLEDIRLLGQVQGSMRLLESAAGESQKLKTDLEHAQRELELLKDEYNQIVSLPWWKRLFAHFTKKG